MPATPPEIPGVIAPPPLLYVVPLSVGLLIQHASPIAFLPPRIGTPVGIALVVLWILLSVAAIREFRRAGTSVNPTRPTSTLVTSGPYRFTRNPMYVSLTLMYLGVTLWANALWPLLVLPIVLVVMQRGVIAREERYLEATFGDEYRRYTGQVRRWF